MPECFRRDASAVGKKENSTCRSAIWLSWKLHNWRGVAVDIAVHKECPGYNSRDQSNTIWGGNADP